MRLRQIALVAHDLESTLTELCEELGADVCFRDPGVGAFGLHNGLLALGDTFLEVVSPTRDGTTAGRYLERRGGDGGYMVLLQLDDEERAATRSRAADRGIREVWQAEDTHGTDHIVGTHFHPGDTGGAILSVDTSKPAISWGWAGNAWSSKVRTERTGEILVAELQSADPEGLASRWADLLGLTADGGAIQLDRGELRFVEATDGRGEGLSAIAVRALDDTVSGRSTDLAGIRIDWT